MLKEINIKAKSSDEALKKAVDLLDIAEEYIFVEEISKSEFRAFANISIKLEGKKYLENIFKNFGSDIKMEIRTVSENHYIFSVDTDENALMIGKDGKNLNAIQHMLRLFLYQFSKEKMIINLDIGQYNETKITYLENFAVKTAKEVNKTKTDVKLEPMNSFERRVIHAKLVNMKNIKTESEGFGKDRAIVVKYVSKK